MRSLSAVTRPPLTRRMTGKSDQGGCCFSTDSSSWTSSSSLRASSVTIAAPAPAAMFSLSSETELTRQQGLLSLASKPTISGASRPVGARTSVRVSCREASLSTLRGDLLLGGRACEGGAPGKYTFEFGEHRTYLNCSVPEEELTDGAFMGTAAL